MKIWHYQGCSDIGVVVATKWLHYLFFLGTGTLQNRSQELFSPIRSPRCSWSLSRSLRGSLRNFGMKNTVRKGKSWLLAVICRKRSAFDLLFHLLVALIFSTTYVKDRGDSSAWLLESKEGFISMYRDTLVSDFVNISVYFNKLANSLSRSIDFLKELRFFW